MPAVSENVSTEMLRAAADAARASSYAPYSRFRVGAALVDDRGSVYTGCNVENAAYPNGSCAETGAIAQMVRDGGRLIRTLVVVGGRDAPEPCSPCGGCRQRILEFSDESTRVWCIDAGGRWVSYPIAELLPGGFRM